LRNNRNDHYFLLHPSGSCGDIVMTQTPGSVTVSPGDTVVMLCKSSISLYYSGDGKSRLHWHQQKPGQTPKLLFDYVNSRHTGTPERFSGSGSGTDFTLTITRILAEDAAVYYCRQSWDFPITVIQSRTKTFFFCF
uniref:Ig-like domain-containing protein n=1 Tax=Leptobrachium leishanense TaxID=445787 RepID=A0A8C5MBF7_9ANUR